MSAAPHDVSSKKRVLELLKILIENPGYYTKKELSALFQVSVDTISRDFEDLRNAGFTLDCDTKYRYYLTQEKATDLIEDLLILCEAEKQQIRNALVLSIPETKAKRIANKLENLTSLPRLGNTIFTKPYLQKTNLLFKAMRDKQKVVLHNYKSTNSNTHSDRLTEPFHVSPEEDILHAFDLDRHQIRHFRISRIERVTQLNEDWANEGLHNIIATDIFKIANKDQVKVHVRIKTGGYNELIERYPLSKGCLSPSADKEDEYDLECMVNRNFYGLQNFLLGYHEYVVEILENEELRQHMNKKLKNISY
ncbi:WYL domain-containing protein [Marinilongibacter aquaticus]|uniref:helix-turn-helix transcriptional regulator n=1 Tax=Marinilongibacter aquaticus TaxID=2975157 RepID=UPI0021BD512D|nr:WYL domain-containing protein [Marinilongibacter aquaticus]UBM57204.1 WYL domain-containing protein [Marinilongibacter aquaticus]